MSITLELRPELEAELRDAAARAGMDADSFAARELEQLLHRTGALPPRLRRDESELLQKINEGLPESTWNRYRQLVRKRRAESLTSSEYTELLAVGDLIEQTHVRRLEYVLELAKLRGVPFEQLMRDLGIRPRRI